LADDSLRATLLAESSSRICHTREHRVRHAHAASRSRKLERTVTFRRACFHADDSATTWDNRAPIHEFHSKP